MSRKLLVRWYHVAPAILALVLVASWIAWRSLEKKRAAEEEARVAAEAAAAMAEDADPTLPAPDPETAAAIDFPTQPVTLFWPRADGTGLSPVEGEIFATQRVTDRAKQVVELLLRGPQPEDPAASSGDETADVQFLAPLPEGTRLNAAFVDARGTAYISLSSELVTGARGGSAWEMTATYSVVNSLVRSLPEVDRVQLLVDGREIETVGGHLDARFPFSFNEGLVARGAEGG